MPQTNEGMTYEETGVDYSTMDPFKMACQKRAVRTADNAKHLGVIPCEWTRGESVYIVRLDGHHYGHVEEGLGTKNLVADAMRKITGKTYYDQIAQDTVPMIVNDMATLGIMPVTVAMHLAVGSSDWFNDKQRVTDLVEGWGKACDLARCIWAGGETPTLKGIIMPEAALLSGSAFGTDVGGECKIGPSAICERDVIVVVESSGIHANCLTLARSIADKLPGGYSTKLPDGRMYGEVLLDPTHTYCAFVGDCIAANIDIHYMVHVTGHGWRKLMRATQSFTYVIDTLPTQLPIFDFIQQHGPVDDKEAYGNLNMGAGFALYVPETDVERIVRIAAGLGLRAFAAGHVENGDKKVVIKPKNLVYEGKTLSVR